MSNIVIIGSGPAGVSAALGLCLLLGLVMVRIMPNRIHFACDGAFR